MMTVCLFALGVSHLSLSSQCDFLIDYCSEFVNRNIDGVLNVAKKSELNQYLNDMLEDSLHRSGRRYRDDHHHPFIADTLTAGNQERPTFDLAWLSSIEKWTTSCTAMLATPVVRNLISSTSLAEDEPTWNKHSNSYRRFSSCLSETEASGRSRSISIVSDVDPVDGMRTTIERHEGVLDQCIKRTARMDLSTTTMAEQNSLWLAKEIRSVRKKLNQIKKLQESPTALTTAEQAKIDRGPTLETQLSVYQNALRDVESRIKELLLEESSETLTEKELPSAKKNSEQDKVKPLNSTTHTSDDNDGEKLFADDPIKPFFCELCSVKCPDETSFELHNNGRKHRNRVAQAAEDEKAKVATAIMEQQRRDQLLQSDDALRSSSIKTPVKKAWGTPSSVQPKYTLPPPPHPTVAHVTSPSSPWGSKPLTTPATKGSGPAMKPQNLMGHSGFTEVAKKPPKELRAPKPFNPKDLTVMSNSSMRHSKLGSPQFIPPEIYSAALLPDSGKSSTGNAFSLSDFLTPAKQASVAGQKSWSSPSEKSGQPKKSLAEIQAEEHEFNSRQDRAYEKGGGTWFIERKERADSLLEIQNNAREEQERLEFIEEQKMIEAQIRKDLAQQEQQKQKQKNKRNAQMKKNGNITSQNGHPSGNNASANRRSSRQTNATSEVDDNSNVQASNSKHGKAKRSGNERARQRTPKEKK